VVEVGEDGQSFAPRPLGGGPMPHETLRIPQPGQRRGEVEDVADLPRQPGGGAVAVQGPRVLAGVALDVAEGEPGGNGAFPISRLAEYIEGLVRQVVRVLVFAPLVVGLGQVGERCPETQLLPDLLAQLHRPPGDGHTLIGPTPLQGDFAHVNQGVGLETRVASLIYDGERVSGVEDIQRLMVGEKIGVTVDVLALRSGQELRLGLVPRELTR